MSFRMLLLLPVSALSLFLFALPNRADDPPPVPKEEEPEFLGRGPVHEAYAQPLEQVPTPGPIVPKEPPPALEENPPEERPEGNDVEWVPGYWQWDDERQNFIWVSGLWRKPPPGRSWLPGDYLRTENGWQRSPGMWLNEARDEMRYYPAPPEPQEEIAPEPPDENSIWVPGTWMYRATGFRWRPGYYMPYQPNWLWMPACWRWTPAGYCFVSGYWDYPPARRGWLYASAAFGPGFRFGPDYRFTPSYVVPFRFLPGALFVRGGSGNYYYGDYYGTEGFTPFVDYRIGQSGYDPFYSYYRRTANPDRLREVQSLYGDRASGQAPRPPRNLAQQRGMVPASGSANLRNMIALTEPANATRRPRARVTPQDRVRVQAQTKRTREAAGVRRDAEHNVRNSGGKPLTTGDAPRVARVPSTRLPRSGQTSPSLRAPGQPRRTADNNTTRPPNPRVNPSTRQTPPRVSRPPVNRPTPQLGKTAPARSATRPTQQTQKRTPPGRVNDRQPGTRPTQQTLKQTAPGNRQPVTRPTPQPQKQAPPQANKAPAARPVPQAQRQTSRAPAAKPAQQAQRQAPPQANRAPATRPAPQPQRQAPPAQVNKPPAQPVRPAAAANPSKGTPKANPVQKDKGKQRVK